MTFQSRYAGILNGLSNLKKNNSYEIKPYLNFKALSSEETNKKSISDFGFDFTTNIISGVKGSLTYNTDFAEAEVDQRKVNITRFPLRFPEKRSFLWKVHQSIILQMVEVINFHFLVEVLVCLMECKFQLNLEVEFQVK